jgi:hypothetical protein
VRVGVGGFDDFLCTGLYLIFVFRKFEKIIVVDNDGINLARQPVVVNVDVRPAVPLSCCVFD